MSDLVSVIIVCHNNWPDLELAIQSALQQTYRPVEVIVVDNGSTDATPSEVPRLFGSRVRYFQQANKGDGAGYNAGFRVCAGEFIQHLDGDDFLAPNKIEKHIAAFRLHPDADVVYGEVRRFQSLTGPAQWEDWNTGEHPDMLQFLIASAGRLSRHALLYRRQVLAAVGELDEALYRSDTEHWFRIAWAGYRFQYCPGVSCFYRKRPGQKSSDRLAWLRGEEELWEKLFPYITAEPYREMICSNLGRCRFYRALSDPAFPARQALTHLRKARAIDPAVVNRAVFLAGATLILLPGGRWMIRMRWLHPLRHWISRLLGLASRPSPEQPQTLAAGS